VRQRILELGSIAVSEERTTPQYLAGFIKSEIEKWAGPIRASGVTMELRAFSLIFCNVRSANGGNETAMART
jgi:hypothetical protein